MEYTTLGKTGLRVSRLGFGGATAGDANYLARYNPRDAASHAALLDALGCAYAEGVNFYDTAAAYGKGGSERLYGDFLRCVPRDEVVIATKVTPNPVDVMRRSIENSLENLGTDYIDIIQIHNSVYTQKQLHSFFHEGVVEMLLRAKEEGLVRHLGFSGECQNPYLYQMIHSGAFEVMQVQYNFAFQHPFDPMFKCGSLYDAHEEGLGVVAMRSLTSGIFQKWVKMVNPASTFDFSPALLQFVLSNPFVQVALVGMRSAGEVRQNVAVCNDLDGRIDIEKDVHVHMT